jgi:cardiolipin synthase
VSQIRLIAWVPNLITLARLLSVPVVVYLIMIGHHTAAFWVFLAAGVSDALDGFIAKHFKVDSVFGAYLDPLADKALLVAVYLTLGSMDHIAIWLVILIVFRDLLIIGGAILVQTVTQSLTMEPLLVSKVNTTAQITLAGLVLARLGLGLPAAEVEFVLTFVAAATTFASGAAYVVTWVRRVATYEGEP